jgi:hypothetical protein
MKHYYQNNLPAYSEVMLNLNFKTLITLVIQKKFDAGRLLIPMIITRQM